MSSHWIAKVALVCVLVFSQALYAEHAVRHDIGQSDCQICLQASAGGAALPATPPVVPCHLAGPATPSTGVSTAPKTLFRRTLHCRAPPVLSS